MVYEINPFLKEIEIYKRKENVDTFFYWYDIH